CTALCLAMKRTKSSRCPPWASSTVTRPRSRSFASGSKAWRGKSALGLVPLLLLAAHASCADGETVLVKGSQTGGLGGTIAVSSSTESSSTGDSGTGGSTASSTATSDPSSLGLSFESIELDGKPSFVTHFEFLPDSSEFLATTRHGRVLHYLLDDDTTTLLGEFEVPVFVEQDCGLISLTLDPDFEDNQFIYL